MQFPAASDYYGFHDAAYAGVFSEWCKDRNVAAIRMQALSAETATAGLLNRSGFVREFSLRVLITQDWTAALRPVVQRLNDYVPINRQLAQQLVLHWIAELPFAAVVDALPDIYALEQQSRANFALVMDAVRGRLAEADSRRAVLAGLLHNRPAVRLQCWKLCLQLFDWSAFERVGHALASGDVVLAYRVEPDIYTLTDAEILGLLSERRRLVAMPLRRAVYLTTWRRKLWEPDALVELALWDSSHAIRWMARVWSKDQPDTLVAEYRRVLAESSSIRQKRFALEGLAQLRRADTLDCCNAAMQDGHPSVRKSALEALCGIDPQRRTEYLQTALHDPDLALIRQCLEIATKTGDHFLYEDLEPIAKARRGEAEFFVHLVNYARNVTGWLGIHLVSLCRFADPGLREAVQMSVDTYIRDWTRLQLYASPTSKQWTEVSDWLQVDKLDARSELRFIFDGQAKRMK